LSTDAEIEQKSRAAKGAARQQSFDHQHTRLLLLADRVSAARTMTATSPTAIDGEKEGDNLRTLKVVPLLVTCSACSGDANQGGEVQVLMRELNELETPGAAREGVLQPPRCRS
jgi:hypothetical protein